MAEDQSTCTTKILEPKCLEPKWLRYPYIYIYIVDIDI